MRKNKPRGKRFRAVGAKYLTNSDSQLNTYVYLHNAADWALEQAQKDEEGRFYNCMSDLPPENRSTFNARLL